jgi:hypothetical protein
MQYPQLRAACEALAINVSETFTGRDELGKPTYAVMVTSPAFRGERRLEVISTWSDDPAYECVSFMLRMAHEMIEDRDWHEHYHKPFNVSGYYDDHEQVYARLRWVLTDAQIINLTEIAEDDEHENEQEG